MGRLVSILALVLAGAVCLPVDAQAAFGVDDFDVTFSNPAGTPVTQAGAHPFAMTTSLGMNLSGEEPDGRLRELFLDLPPGLVANGTATPRCPEADFETLDEGVNDCPMSTVLGVASAAVGDADNQSTSRVFNLVRHSGELMRLGFQVGGVENVFVDVGLSPRPPYEATASVADFPEAIELFGAELDLWGVPAAPEHDAQRGSPSSVQEFPLLTLPTSCEGPQATFYEAVSWEDDFDSGNALTHDEAGEPLGFTDCSRLAFGPVATAQLTTEAAGSPTELEVSVAFSDEGLANPNGLAQSQVRDLVLALPEGMTAGPSLTASSGGCSEAEVEAETPESMPGEGCPDSSEVGTAEVESPLVDYQLIQGSVYRAPPNENFADSPMTLYVVLKNADLGIAITQPVALETDPDTGQLLAIAEEMPQLPFSDLTLHLDDGKGGPLVSPPLCGEYETEAEFDPWAGGGTIRTLSAFQISSGPNDGPCPTGADESNSESADEGHSGSGRPADGSPPATSAPAVPPKLVAHKHRCRKGWHKVQRHGKTRCVRTHRKHKAHAR